MMSFMKAATNHSDFIEFDVHVTRDGIVVVRSRLPHLSRRLPACGKIHLTQMLHMCCVQVKAPNVNDTLSVCASDGCMPCQHLDMVLAVTQVHHDFEVKLAVGSETLAIGIPCLTSAQLQR